MVRARQTAGTQWKLGGANGNDAFLFVPGPAKRYRMKAIQTSKACNTTCIYTSFVAIDTNTKEGPVGSVEVRNRGMPDRDGHKSQAVDKTFYFSAFHSIGGEVFQNKLQLWTSSHKP